MPRMIVMSDRGAVQHVSLRAGKTILSPDADNGVVVESKRVSPSHVVLIKKGAAVWVRDVHSSNGSFVNDKRMAWCRLEHGDTGVIGDYKLRPLDDIAANESVTMTPSHHKVRPGLPCAARWRGATGPWAAPSCLGADRKGAGIVRAQRSLVRKSASARSTKSEMSPQEIEFGS